MSLRVTSIQRGCVNDGPGVRTVVFLKGCSLRCPWCCNPETQLMEHQAYINNDKCLLYKKCPSQLCNNCVRVGGTKDLNQCVFGVYEEVAKDYEVSQLFEEINNDEKLFRETGGGITFSGGEPMLQAESLLLLLKLLNNKGFHIAIETTLVAPT